MTDASLHRGPAILLVTYNGWALTEACLQGLRELVSEGYAIVVADNGSTDGTPRHSVNRFPEICCVSTGGNLGFGAGNNCAARQVPLADPLLFVNNDTLPSAQDIRQLVASWRHLSTETAAPVVLAPRILNADGSTQSSWFAPWHSRSFFFNALRTEASAARILQGTLTSRDDGVFEVGWTSAVCWVLSRSLWQATRGFDESIFMYNEDLDWAWRARTLGAQFLLDTRCSLVHLGGGSAVSSLSRSLQHDRSLYYVLGKHLGFKGRIWSISYRIIRSTLRILLLLPFLWKASARRSVRLHAALLFRVFG